ncbi:MAG: HAD-IA family hydrolase [Burkholderiaceae bacterium]
MLHALIWDVDGTIAETERDGHRVAFNESMREHGVGRSWDVVRYGELLSVSGGLERILADMRALESRNEWPSLDDVAQRTLATSIHGRKSEIYRGLLDKGTVAIRPGVMRLMKECQKAGVVQGIASTSKRANVDALLGRMFDSNWTNMFEAVITGDEAARKKPEPDVYLEALTHMQYSSQDVIVIEDSPNGLQAARAAALCTIVTPSAYFVQAEFDEAAMVCADLDQAPSRSAPGHAPVTLATLRALHGRWHHA